MSDELRYKKLAELSFDDLYVEQKDEVFPEIRMAMGRAYANIHRRSQHVPQSLRVQPLTDTNRQESRATFVLPQMKHAHF